MPRYLLPETPRSTRAQGGYETHGFGGLVQQIVTSVLPAGYPDVHSVAKMMGISARTLQRRLYDEGVTYGRVVAQARFAAALQMLDDPTRKVIDVALDLGYSDPAHFARAFARWTGLAPREFRRLRSTGSGGRLTNKVEPRKLTAWRPNDAPDLETRCSR